MLLVLGLAVQLAPLVLQPVVLTQDGPAHVAGAWVLLHHGDDGSLGELLREHYAVDLSPVPNMLTTLLLSALLTVAAPEVAEKVVVGGFVVLLVAGLRFALRGVDRRAGWLAVAALPLAGSALPAWGFYNFCYGVALALFSLGVALRRRGGWDLRGGVLLAVLLLLTWSAHLLPWAVAALVLGGLAVTRSVLDLRQGLRLGQVVRAHLSAPALALLPTVVLSARYVLRGDTAPGAAAGGPGWARLGELLTLARPLVVSSWLELLPAMLVSGTVALLVVGALRRPTTRPGAVADTAAGDVPDPADRAVPGVPDPADRAVLGAAAVLTAAAFLLSPSRLGDDYGFLPDRLAWFPPLLLVLFCATRPPDRPAVQRIATAGLVLAASVAVLVRLPTQLRDQEHAAEVLSVAAQLPSGSTFAVLRFDRYEAALAPWGRGPNPLRHLSSRLAVRTGGVDVGHYEAVYPYFQVRFAGASVREAVDPGLDGLPEVPPTVDLLAADGRLDHVLVVGLDEAEPWVRDARRTAHVLTDLRAGYERVSVSGPAGHVQVWRFRDHEGG